MNSQQVVQCLLKDGYTRTAFQGVFSVDNLPLKVYYPCAIVVNTDTSEGVGEHWTSIYINCFAEGVYFDSFGLGPRHPAVLGFLASHTIKWSYVDVQIQNVLSTACGFFCIYFLHKLCRGATVPQFLRPFARLHLYQNDVWIRTWANHYGRDLFSIRW